MTYLDYVLCALNVTLCVNETSLNCHFNRHLIYVWSAQTLTHWFYDSQILQILSFQSEFVTLLRDQSISIDLFLHWNKKFHWRQMKYLKGKLKVFNNLFFVTKIGSIFTGDGKGSEIGKFIFHSIGFKMVYHHSS